MCFYGGKIQESLGVILAAAIAPHFKKKLQCDLSQEICLIWFFFFSIFFFWKDTCTKSCLKSKWSGSNSTVKNSNIYFESKKINGDRMNCFGRNINSRIFFFRAITGYPLISTFVDWFTSKILDYQRTYMQISQKGMNTR